MSFFCFLVPTLLGVLPAAGQSTNADLVLGFSSAPNEVSAGQYFQVTIGVYNATVGPSTNVVVTSLLPANATFVEASASQGAVTQSAGVVSCAFGTVNYNQTVTLTIELQTTGLGSITNTATVTADTPDPDPTNNTAAWVTGVTQAKFYGVGMTHAGYGTPPVTLLTNHQVFVTGQWLGLTCDLYNMSNRSFTMPSGTMIGVHADGTATLLTNGLVLLAGGATANGTKTCELYIPASQTFQQVSDMLVYSYGFTATLQSNGTVLLCGGPLAANELFTPGTGTFTYAPSLPCPFNGILLPTGKYLYFGYGYAYLYDPVTQTSTQAAGFQQPRAYHTATLLPNGKVLIAGGQGTWGATENTLASSEIYDPLSNTFSWSANLTGVREYHSACLLPDGTVLLVGGITSVNGSYSPLIGEVYDPNGATNVPGIVVSDASVIQPPSGSNYLNFNISLTMTSSLPVTVQYATSDGTASANGNSFTHDVADYVALTGTVTFPPGSTNQMVQVPVLGTGIQEPTETMYLNLSVPSQAWMARAIATGFILNTNPAPAITVTPVTILQGDSGLSNAVFNVYLSASSLSNVTVNYFTSDQTATAGTDYLATSGTLSFNPGVTNLAISVPVIGGLTPKPTQTFLVTLTDPQNATLAVSSATGTILNVEGTPGRLDHFAWSAIPAPQTQTIGFPVTVTALDYYGNVVSNLPWPVRLSAQTTNVIATNLDFEMPGLAPWTPFDTTGLNHPEQQVLYDVAGLGQPSTAYRTIAGGGTNGISQNIWLAGGISYTFSANFAAESIGYDESCFGAGVYLQVGPTNAVWGTPGFCGGGSANATVKFVYTPPTNGIYPLQINVVRSYYFGDSLVVYADDVQITYPLISPTLVTNAIFTNGIWSGNIVALQSGTNVSLVANDNDGHKGTSNPFSVTATTDIGLSGSSQILGTPPLRTGMQLAFNLAVTNRGPANAANTLVTCPLPVNVSYVTATNNLGTVTNTAGILNWAIGLLPAGSNATASIILQANLPGGITNIFTLTNSIADLTPADNQITITNLISPPLLSIAGTSGVESAATATGMVFNVTLSGPSGQAVSASFFTADGTATNGVDYVGTNGTVTIAPGTTNAAITVFALDDLLNKPNRTFTVNLTNAVNALLNVSNATGTIIDDNPPPVVSISNTSQTKPDSGTINANFPVTMNKPAISDVVISYRTQDGSASNSVDYVGTTYNTVTIPAGSTTANIAVAIIGNTTYHTNLTFSVILTSSSNSTLGTNVAVGTIITVPVAGRLDHFVFDPIPSPQYNSVPFPVTIRGLDYLGAPATNFTYFNDTTVLMAQSAQYYSNYFSANFEDGTLSGWTNTSSPNLLSTNTTDWAAIGAHSLQLKGYAAQSGVTFGLRHSVSNCLPTGISFYVRVAQTNALCGRLTAYGNGGYSAVDFYQNRDGRIGLNSGRGFVGVQSQSNHWFRVDLALDWTRHVVTTMNLDGMLAVTNVSFPIAGPWVDTIALQNTDSSTSWFDEINVYGQFYTNFTVSPVNTTAYHNGVWTGNVTVFAAATNAWLSTTDSFSHFGQSATFNLLSDGIEVTLPTNVVEGMGTVTGYVSIPLATTQASTIFLTSSLPARLTVPTSVTLPAGQTSVSFPLTVIDDALLNGPQNVLVSAGATNLVAGSASIEVDDNESAVLSLGLPAVEPENAGALVYAGHVYASAAPSRPVEINLASGDTTALLVPPQVVLPAGATSAVFTITMVDNLVIEGTRYVPITASFANWTPGTNFITVLDSENTNLTIAGPAQVSKGDPPASYTLGIDGFLTNNLMVALNSTDTNRLIVPATATIIAGTTSVVFQASIVNDHLYTGSETVAISATASGFNGISTNVLVLDNMVHHFDFMNVPGLVTSTVPFQVTVAARDINDGPIIVDNGSLTLSATGSGSPIILQPTNISLASGTWTGSVTVATTEPQITLHVVDTNGVAGQSAAIAVVPPVVCLLNINAADLVYSPVSQRLWALVSSNGTLVPINPLLYQSETAVPVGQGSVRLATSGDGTYVHIANNANDGTNPAVHRFNTLTRATDIAFTNQGYFIQDIKAMPGNPATVAVSWYQPGYSPYGRGVFLYDNGIARTNGGGGDEIEWGESSNRLYGYNLELSSFDFWLMNVDASGLTTVKDLPFINYDISFTCAGGLVFARGGIFDPERGIQIGGTTGSAFAGSSATGRYWQFDSSPGRITAFDIATLLPIGTTYLTGVSNAAGKLIPWSGNGLAFRANSGQVAIAQTSLVPSGPPADLVLTATATGLPAAVSNAFTCTLTISNLGPNIASNVVLAQTLPINSMLTAVTGGNAWTQATGGLVVWVSNLVSGAHATVKTTLTGTNAGLATLIASATSDTTDPNLSNNVARLNISVGLAPGPDTVTVISQVTSDIAWNAAANRLVASVPNAQPALGNSLLSFNPLTGAFDPPIPTGTEPDKLAVSANGQYVYAGLDDDNSVFGGLSAGDSIQRVDFSNHVADLIFPTGYDYVSDMAVLPDNPHAVVATVHSTLSVYDDGVPRPNAVGPTEYNQNYFLALTSPSNCYSTYPTGFRQILINTNGASLVSDTRNTVVTYSDWEIHYGAGRMFTPGGRVFDPVAGTNIATVPYSGLVAPDETDWRVFYLAGSGATWTLNVLDITNLTLVNSITIGNVSGSPSRLIRWGADGLAFRTTGGQIFLVRTTSADDRNNDGLPDSWQLEYFGSMNAPGAGPNDNPAGDGFTNLQKYKAGLNPLVFYPLQFTQAGPVADGGFQVTVLGNLGTNYVLMASSDLISWSNLFTFTSTNIPTVITDPGVTNVPRRFYRVQSQ